MSFVYYLLIFFITNNSFELKQFGFPTNNPFLSASLKTLIAGSNCPEQSAVKYPVCSIFPVCLKIILEHIVMGFRKHLVITFAWLVGYCEAFLYNDSVVLTFTSLLTGKFIVIFIAASIFQHNMLLLLWSISMWLTPKPIVSLFHIAYTCIYTCITHCHLHCYSHQNCLQHDWTRWLKLDCVLHSHYCDHYIAVHFKKM